MYDISIKILKSLETSCERVECRDIVYTSDHGDDDHRISVTHEDHIREEASCPTVTIGEWMYLHESVVELTREKDGMSYFIAGLFRSSQ